MHTALARALVPFLLASLLASACKERERPEDAIRRTLDEAVAALEKNDVKAAGEALSDAYADRTGRSKQQLKGIALFALRRGPVSILVRDVQVVVEGEKATATLAAYAVQGAAEVKTAKDLLPQRARRFDLTVGFAREGDAWRVTSIEGDGATGGAFE